MSAKPHNFGKLNLELPDESGKQGQPVRVRVRVKDSALVTAKDMLDPIDEAKADVIGEPPGKRARGKK